MVAAADGVPAVDFDLAKIRGGKCSAASGDIVVCGRDRDVRNRLPDAAPLPEPQMPRAEIDIAGVTASAGLQGADVGGFPSNRMMLTLKRKF